MRHRSTRRHDAAVLAVLGLLAVIVLGACTPGAGPAMEPGSGPVTPVTGTPSIPPSTASATASPAPPGSHVPSQRPEVSSMSVPTPAVTTVALSLTSSDFAAGGPIPAEFTCRGADRSPALSWSGVPAGTAAIVLFVDDPDGRDWVHWSVLDLPAGDGGLPRGVAPSADPPQQGRNDFGRIGYGGPCPPSGTHRYRFTLYALASALGLPGHPDGAAVRRALRASSVLEQVTLIGTFRA
jgi:Raf kinase inhibitor-like YbhB/YbcL family protein